MANPQPDQFTKVSNEILDHIVQFKFNGTQLRIIMAIWRYTYGFNRKSAELSLGFISKATGIPERHVRKEVDRLIEFRVLNVLKEHSTTSPREIGFNKDYDQWSIYTSGANEPEEQIHPTGGEQIDRRGGEQLLHSGEEQLLPQERKPKDISKENIKDMSGELILFPQANGSDPPPPDIKPRDPFKSKTQERQFDQFWDKYIKKKSQGQAEKTWVKINPDETLFKTIMDGLEKAVNSQEWSEKAGKYIPYPSTWLNAKGWLDEYKPRNENQQPRPKARQPDETLSAAEICQGGSVLYDGKT